MKGAADIELGSCTEQDTGGIHQKQIRTAEPGGLNRTEDIRWIPASHAGDYVRGGQTGVIGEVGSFGCVQTEVTEAMEEIRSIPGSSTARDIEDTPTRLGHYCAEAAGRNVGMDDRGKTRSIE